MQIHLPSSSWQSRGLGGEVPRWVQWLFSRWSGYEWLTIEKVFVKVPLQMNPWHCQCLQTIQIWLSSSELLSSRGKNQPFKPRPDSKSQDLSLALQIALEHVPPARVTGHTSNLLNWSWCILHSQHHATLTMSSSSGEVHLCARNLYSGRILCIPASCLYSFAWATSPKQGRPKILLWVRMFLESKSTCEGTKSASSSTHGGPRKIKSLLLCACCLSLACWHLPWPVHVRFN